MIARLLPLLLASALAACTPDYGARVRAAKDDNERLLAERNANAAFLKAADEYEAELSGGAKATSLYWTAASIERLAAEVLPVRLDARTFHKQLDGTIIVERVTNLRFQPGNAITATASLRGEKIRFTGSVPAMFKDEVLRFQAGVAEGVELALEGSVVLEGGQLRAMLTGTRASMRKNGSANSENMLLEEVNKRALRTPFTYDVTLPETGAKAKRVVLTGNHLVVTYGP